MNGQAGFHHLVELTGIHNQTQAHALAAAEAGLEQCILCLDEMPIKDLVATRCPPHRMCKPCLTARLNRALKYEIDHPVYCCFPQYAIRIDDVKEHFPPEFIQEYKAKTAEYNTAPRNRVYCATPRCSAFLQESAAVDAAGKDSDVLTSRTLHCPSCGANTCSTCKAAVDDTTTEHVCKRKAEDLGYTKQNRCKSCPSCHTLIQLVDACNHIMCTVCRHQFCFVCLRPFREIAVDGNHKCPSYGDPEYNKYGYGADGFHRDTGLDREGYDRSGFNIHSLNRDRERKPAARESTRLPQERLPPEGSYAIRTPQGPPGGPQTRRHPRTTEGTYDLVEQYNAAQLEAARRGLAQRRGALSGPDAQECRAALLQAVQVQLQNDLSQIDAEHAAAPNPVHNQAGVPAPVGSSAVHIPPAPQAASGVNGRTPLGRPSPQILLDHMQRMHQQHPAPQTWTMDPARLSALPPLPLSTPVGQTPQWLAGAYPPSAPSTYGAPRPQSQGQPQGSAQNTPGPFQPNPQGLPAYVGAIPATWQPLGEYPPSPNTRRDIRRTAAFTPLGSALLQQLRGPMPSQPGPMAGVTIPHSLRHHRAPVLNMPSLSTLALGTPALGTPAFSTPALGTPALGVPPAPMQHRHPQPNTEIGTAGPDSVAMDSLRQFQDEWPAFLSRT